MFRLRFVMPMLVVGLLTGSWLLGQDKKDDSKDPIVIKAKLPANFSKLGLSDKQKKEIYKIRGKYAAKIEELQQQIAALRKQEKTAVEDVLTDAQKARLKELRAGESSKDREIIKDKPTEIKRP